MSTGQVRTWTSSTLATRIWFDNCRRQSSNVGRQRRRHICTKTGNKRAKIAESEDEDDEPPALHLACCNQNVTVQEVDVLLRQDPKPLSLHPQRFARCRACPVLSFFSNSVKAYLREVHFPLNIAIHHKVNHAVIHMLVDASPSVLVLSAGPEPESPLAVCCSNLSR